MPTILRIFVVSLLAITMVSSCDSSGSSRQFQQYMSMGKLVYQKNCTNCHQHDGNGYERLYPPLNKADFLESNPEAALCILYHGRKEPLMINGVEYNMKMPRFDHLSSDELAKVMTYITNAWDNEKGHLFTEQEIEDRINTCNQ